MTRGCTFFICLYVSHIRAILCRPLVLQMRYSTINTVHICQIYSTYGKAEAQEDDCIKRAKIRKIFSIQEQVFPDFYCICGGGK